MSEPEKARDGERERDAAILETYARLIKTLANVNDLKALHAIELLVNRIGQLEASVVYVDGEPP